MFHGVFDSSNSIVVRGSKMSNQKSFLIESPAALHLLVRIVDDFLLVSTDYDTSLRFLERLNKGEAALGLEHQCIR
jgi:hypothetical protein